MLTFFQTYSLINCLYLNKLLSLGSEILAAYVKVIFFLFLFYVCCVQVHLCVSSPLAPASSSVSVQSRGKVGVN